MKISLIFNYYVFATIKFVSIVIVFPFIIWFYGSAIVIIMGWGCGFGNRREDIVAWSDNRKGTFFYSPRAGSKTKL
jgi:hypothetical protein